METPNTDSAAAVEALTLAVMTSCGQLTLILDHMHRYRAEAGGGNEADSVPAVLQRLLQDVLEQLALEHDVADIATTAQMLDTVTRTIGDELFFVDVSRLQKGT
jgi:hypothetical protein